MKNLKTWKGFSCVRSDATKEGAQITDIYFTCDFKRNFAEIGAFKNINVHLTYRYDTSVEETGIFQVAITQHHGITFDRIYDGEKKIKNFLSTDQEQIFNKFKEFFAEDDFLNRYFSKAFD